MNELQAIEKSKGIQAALSAYGEGLFPLELDSVEGALGAFIIQEFLTTNLTNIIAVTATEHEASILAQDLDTLGVPVITFPWWGIAPYKDAAPLSTVFGERMAALAALITNTPAVFIIPERAFLTPVPPPDYIRSLLFNVQVGDSLDTAALAERLGEYGYTRVPRVQLHGEFALRGEVFDICMEEGLAYRILLDFDHVEKIRPFDPATQVFIQNDVRANNYSPLLTIIPMKEVIWTDERIETLEKTLTQCPEFDKPGIENIIAELYATRTIAGEEMFFPLAFTDANLNALSPPPSGGRPGGGSPTILDYISNSGTVIYLDKERLINAQDALDREYKSLFRGTKNKPLPERLLLNFNELSAYSRQRVSFMGLRGGGEEGATRIDLSADPPRSFFGNINYLKDEFTNLLKNDWQIVVAAESEVQAGRINELLNELTANDANPANNIKKTNNTDKLNNQNVRVVGVVRGLSIIPAPLSAGFALPDIKFILIQENEIFGRRRRPPRSLKTVQSAVIDTFVELNPGDYIVHVNYGIGLFKGIERIRSLGHERDYIKIEYADEETVFVPIEQVNLVQRYIGNEGLPPRLDKLGSKSWENRKNRVSKSVEDLAEHLLGIYSKRKATPGFAFEKDTEWQTMFEAAFPFEETVDQLRCVEEIKADMESPHPMDRLVCGDVGYGKTEVALRACFKAVMGGKQVAFLAPTTILAEQHYENFVERFSNFPVKVAMLSRLVEHKAVKKTLEDCKNGAIDILVGTHRIIQKDVAFKELGLLVIDEEQRFGVKDKERLKELKANVDCLTLSATPIPRTLHMSLLKIRDMSLLTTPPQNRHPIETQIDEWDEEKVAKAIRAEVERGGQVFFLHNRVESLTDTRIKLEHLVPEMLIETAHGQMDSRQLEDVMHRFIHGAFHVLVSTTIIENGIDIPNVNTIIIDRADMYGVSQLYQLRGRVGRSDRVAYAYLFYPAERALSELAMKRLQVISDFTELGSGFKIAMKDMEIRGAGNLLGREQSGDIYSVGFDLYMQLLENAVHRLENQHYEAEAEPLLELEYSGFIPNSWIDSPQEKMEVYKKIAAVLTREELDALNTQLVDRFGPLPDEADSLLALAEIRIIAKELAIVAIKERTVKNAPRWEEPYQEIHIEFGKVSKVKVDRLIRLIKESGGKARLDPKAPNVLILRTENIGLKEKSEFLREKLEALTDL
ncbi:MAG: transcription-repair coupling factor [Spirochaetaceae bacterium]|jgi:transcription-repair coupling factor (superfamily II helicase)|nr:transcription-repair coupling factor [Spirochaetaceae bacterium]